MSGFAEKLGTGLRFQFRRGAEEPLRPAATTAETKPKPREKRPAPVSLRLTKEERERLQREALGRSMSEHIRERLFKENITPRRTRGKMPVKDYEALGRALALLGRSDLYTSLAALVLALEENRLVVRPEIDAEIRAACAAVIATRNDLVKALGLKPE